MSKFKSQEEYDDWRAHHALKRQRAKDLAKHDAEHPVYIAEKKVRIIGVWGFIGLVVVIAAVLYFTTPGQQFLAWVARSVH